MLPQTQGHHAAFEWLLHHVNALSYRPPFKVVPVADSLFYISRLGTLIAPSQQQDNFLAFHRIVHPVARPVVHPQLPNTLPHWLAVSKSTRRQAVHPHSDTRFGHSITQTIKP